MHEIWLTRAIDPQKLQSGFQTCASAWNSPGAKIMAVKQTRPSPKSQRTGWASALWSSGAPRLTWALSSPPPPPPWPVGGEGGGEATDVAVEGVHGSGTHPTGRGGPRPVNGRGEGMCRYEGIPSTTDLVFARCTRRHACERARGLALRSGAAGQRSARKERMGRTGSARDAYDLFSGGAQLGHDATTSPSARPTSASFGRNSAASRGGGRAGA